MKRFFLFGIGIATVFIVSISLVNQRRGDGATRKIVRPDQGKVEIVTMTPKSPGMKTDLNDIEEIMERFFRNDPLAKTQLSVNESVAEYNRWVETKSDQLTRKRKALETKLAAMRRLETRIGEFDQRLGTKPSLFDQSAVQAFNALVADRNHLVAAHRDQYELYKKDEQAYNEEIEEFQTEMTARKEEVEAGRHDLARDREAYQQWRNADNDRTFFSEVNRLFAALTQEQRRTGKDGELSRKIARLRDIRAELGTWAIRKHEEAETGLILVRATLCRAEDCLLVVDTGATAVTISPALVEALDLTGRLGKEIRVTLAGGVQIKGQELIIPRISVLGMEAQDVEAVVLSESEVGVDGLLGLSFLDRFAFRIDRRHDPKLILKPKTGE